MKYPREKLFFVCTGPRCNNPDRGEERGEVIREDLKALNKSLGRKPIARVCATSCLDLCDFGPNMVIDHRVYSHLTRDLAKATVGLVDTVLSGKTPDGLDTTTYNNDVKVVPSILLTPYEVDATNYQKLVVDSGYIKAEDLK